MRELVFSAQARRDLIEAWEYVAADNVSAADRLRDRVQYAALRLAEMPGIGHTRADVTSPRYRFWSVRPYVLAYRYTAKTVTIVRVLHGSRDFSRSLRGRK